MNAKLITIGLLTLAAVAGYHFRDRAEAGIASYLSPPDSGPIPTMRLEKRAYQVEVLARGELTGFQTTAVATPDVPDGSLKIAWVIPEGSVVHPGDLLVRFDDSGAELKLREQQSRVEGFLKHIDKSEADGRSRLNQLEIDSRAADLELAFSQSQIRRDEEIFSQWEIQESVVSAALAKSRRNVLREKRDSQSRLSRADLDILAIDRRSAEAEVDQAQRTLSALKAAAPVAGVVLYSRNLSQRIEVGAEVWPRQELLEIAELDRFQGRLFVVESEVAGVEPGRPVVFEVDALPGRAFRGSIGRVAAVAQQKALSDPRKYFECTVALDVPSELPQRLKPGMNLLGRIQVGRVEDAFVVPRSAVFKEESGFHVYLDDGQRFIEKRVKIADSDHGFYVISGVSEGDLICLRHPYDQQKRVLPDFGAPTAASHNKRFVVR